MEYLSVRNFAKFQHYKHRRPPWIKLYYALLGDADFTALSDQCRMHVIGIMLLASQYDNRIPFRKAWIARAIFANSRLNWDAIFGSGFIICKHDDSKTLAERQRNAVVETETETETDIQRQIAERGSRRCPANFEVSFEMQAWAEQKYPDLDIEEETEKFKDYEYPKAKKDWPACWRNWIRNADGYRKERERNASKGNGRPGTDRNNPEYRDALGSPKFDPAKAARLAAGEDE